MDVLWESARTTGNSNDSGNFQPETGTTSTTGEVRSRQRYLGYTPNYIRVFCDTESARSVKSLENQILPTQLNAVAFDTEGAGNNSMLSGTIK